MNFMYWHYKNRKTRNTQTVVRLPTKCVPFAKEASMDRCWREILKNNNHNAAETDSKQVFNLNMLG